MYRSSAFALNTLGSVRFQLGGLTYSEQHLRSVLCLVADHAGAEWLGNVTVICHRKSNIGLWQGAVAGLSGCG